MHRYSASAELTNEGGENDRNRISPRHAFKRMSQGMLVVKKGRYTIVQQDEICRKTRECEILEYMRMDKQFSTLNKMKRLLTSGRKIIETMSSSFSE